MNKNPDMIVVRGGGDLATGVVHKLWSMNKRVLILETKQPAAIRRKVAFSEAIYDGRTTIEGATAVRIDMQLNTGDVDKIIQLLEYIWAKKEIPIVADAQGILIDILQPEVVIDGIIAKKNLGTNREMAPLTIALGPGFCAGEDVDVVIETMRGESLGEIITQGYALKNTGIPGEIMGVGKERVIHAKESGILYNIKQIGDVVSKGEVIAKIDAYPVLATIDGVIKGLIRDGYEVSRGFKIADIDPRLEEVSGCDRISDKAKCIGESVSKVVESDRYA